MEYWNTGIMESDIGCCVPDAGKVTVAVAEGSDGLQYAEEQDNL